MAATGGTATGITATANAAELGAGVRGHCLGARAVARHLLGLGSTHHEVNEARRPDLGNGTSATILRLPSAMPARR